MIRRKHSSALEPAAFSVLVLALGTAMFAASGCGQGTPEATPSRLAHLMATGQLTEAEALCRSVLKKTPDDAEARGSLAKVMCLQGDELLAKAGFFARSAAEKREPITAPRYAEARKLFDAALTEAREALRKEPNNGRIRGTLGLALYRTGQSKEAVGELKAALTDLKEDLRAAEVHNTLGLICYDEGKTGEALSYYQAALSLDNTMPEVCYNLAVLYHDEFARLGKAEAREAAVRYYQLFRQYSRGARDEQIEKAIGELEGRGRADGTAEKAGPK